MDKTEITKIVEKELLEFFDEKTLLRHNKEIMEFSIEATLKAINYTRCCKSDSELLKGKHPLTFSKWREINGYTPYDNSSYQKDNKIINLDKLEIQYRAYYKTF
tara:strand:+ start:478 stop:789 length:312 start_codon:yes stop_codon:yes gene_type:complete